LDNKVKKIKHLNWRVLPPQNGFGKRIENAKAERLRPQPQLQAAVFSGIENLGYLKV
jgi:hypothetical protein